MDIHEYQTKDILARFGVPVPKGGLAWSPEQAAYRARELGVAPSAVQRKDLTAENLARAIVIAVDDSGIRERAAALGKSIQTEDGAGAAVRLVEDYMRRA